MNIVFTILLNTFVNSLDHLRLLNSIKEKNIQNNYVNNPKDFWNEPNYDINNKLNLNEIPEFTDEDKKKFFFISMLKMFKDCNICAIFFIIIIISAIIAIIILSYFWIEILWIFLGIISLFIIFPIIYYLWKKERCFCLIFIYNIAYIIAVVAFWSANQCSFTFYIDHKWIWLSFIILEFIIILIRLYNNYKQYEAEGATLSQIDENNKIFPFALVKYINSNLNVDNLLENEIIDENDN